MTHPATYAILGVVDLTTVAQNTDTLLLSYTELDRALFDAHQSACRRSGRPVVAVEQP